MGKQDKHDPDHMDHITAILFYDASFLLLFPILNGVDSIRAKLSP